MWGVVSWYLIPINNVPLRNNHPFAWARIGSLVRRLIAVILDSIVVSIPACHAGDRGSIPRRGDNTFSGFCSFLVPKL